MNMPRHFLVKRHKHCPSSFSYRDRAAQQKQNGTDTFPGTTTTIIDTDKHLIIRNGDAVSEYGAYGSPDSGYAASPNSGQLGFAREKENILGVERENNNSSTKSAVDKAVSYANYYDGSGQRAAHGGIMMEKSLRVDNMEDDALDTPIDLSMPSRKKSAVSPLPVSKYRESPNCFQRPYLTYRHLEPPPLSPHNPAQATLSSAPVMYFNTFNKVYLAESAEKPLATRISPLSPSINAYNYQQTCPDPWVGSMYPPFYGCSISSDPPEDASVTAAYSDQYSRNHKPSGHITTLNQPALLPRPSMSGKRTPNTDQKPPPTQSPTPKQQTTTNQQTGTDLSVRPTPNEMISPLNSPSRKRLISEDSAETNADPHLKDLSKSAPPMKTSSGRLSAAMTTPKVKDAGQQLSKTAAPPKKPNSSSNTGKKLKAVRRLNFDIDTTSPVSGTIIKDAADFHPEDGKVVYGDIEPSFNFVEVTPEARAELEKIENKIGDYICQLCKEFYEDAFQLAQHRCSRIIHVEYMCPECEKVFNCPANLASHRRWHKPRANGPAKLSNSSHSKPLSSNPKIAPRPDSNTDKSMLISPVSSPPPSEHNNHNSESVQAFSDSFIKSAPASDHEVTSDDSQSAAIPRRYHEPASHTEPDTLKPPFRYLASIKSEAAASSLAASDSGTANLKTEGETESGPLSNNSRGSPPVSVLVAPPSRNNTVITTNPLHPTTFGSSLTPEERSLVLQVLSTHNRQYQTATTTITSTTTVMTPLVSDSRCQPEQPIKTHDQVLPKENQKTSNDPTMCLDAQNECAKYLDSYRSASPLNLLPTKDPCSNQNRHRNAIPPQNLTNPTQVECLLCGKKFQRHAYLRKHIQTQHSGNLKKTFEKPSDYNMVKNNGLKSDRMIVKHGGHQGQGHTAFSCTVCGKSFSSETSRIKHETSCHGLPANLACGTCGMTFISKCALDKHVRSTHVTETFSCKYCTSMFHSSPGLTRHINKCHPTENRQVILLQLPASRTF